MNLQTKSAALLHRSKIVVKRNVSGWLLLVPAVFLFYYIVWKPIGIGVVYSFFDLAGFSPTQFTGLRNYKIVLSDTAFLQTLGNTVMYVLWSLVIGMPLPFVCAVMLSEMIHAKGYFKTSTYVPVIVPGVAVYMIWTMIYREDSSGLLNMILSWFGAPAQQWLNNKALTIPLIIVSMTWNGFGSTLLMYLATMQGINQELYSVARIDGAGFWKKIQHVILPHMAPLMLLLIIRQIIGVFQILDQPFVMTGGGPNGASMSLGLTAYYYAFKFNQFGKALALNVIMFVLLVGLTFVYFKVEKRMSE